MFTKSLGDGFCLKFGTLHVVTKYFNFSMCIFPFYIKIQRGRAVSFYMFQDTIFEL